MTHSLHYQIPGTLDTFIWRYKHQQYYLRGYPLGCRRSRRRQSTQGVHPVVAHS